jgi:vitamin B12 transporter
LRGNLPWAIFVLRRFVFNLGIFVQSSPRGGRLVASLFAIEKIMISHALPYATARLRAAFSRASLAPFVFVTAIAFVLPSLSFAQTTDNTSAQTIVVTATRTPEAPRDVLSDNIVITAEEIQQSGQTNLVDLLQQKRGVEITTTGGPGTTASVFIRGAANEQSIVLIDGMRVGSSTSGGATWENIPLSQIDHIEIVYGPLSSLYGADAMGGVVQIFTKQGEGAFHSSVTVGYGSYDTRTVDASVAGSSGGDMKIHYAFDVARDESTGFPATTPNAGPYSYNPNKDGYDKDSVSGQLSMDAGKGHTVGLSFLQTTNNAQFDQDPVFVDHLIENLNNYTLYSRDQFLPGWSSLLQLAQSEDKASNTNGADEPNSIFDTTQSIFSWQNDIALGPNMLQIIVERREEKVDTNTAGLGGERDTNSLAASYQWKSGNQLAVVSLRDDDSNQFGSQTTGSLAYGYHFTSALRANASLGTSFRAPTFNELYYPGYGIASDKPEKGKNAEIGLYYDDGVSQLSAAYYHNRITDLLVYAPVCPIEVDSHPFGCAYNVDHAVLSGVTLGAKTKLDNFTLHGSLDFQDPRDETTDTILARRARQHGSVGVDYHEGKIQAGVDSVFSGKRSDVDYNSNPVVLGGYGLLNLHANYDLSDDWTLFARWNNVLNRSYELAYGYATPGSNLFVGLRYGFK